MRGVLDNMIAIEDTSVEVESWERDSIDRSVAGLDGILSIDLGMRGREILQKGILRAASGEGLSEKIASVQVLMDGKSHTLSFDDGREFADIRIDAFEVGRRQFGGSGVSCACVIKYTQLKAS